MYSFCRIYGSKDESAELDCSYMPQNKCDNLNTTAQNSANSALIGEDVIDKDEDGVDKPEIFAGAEYNEDEYDGERQDTPPAESDNVSTLQEINYIVSAEMS